MVDIAENTDELIMSFQKIGVLLSNNKLKPKFAEILKDFDEEILFTSDAKTLIETCMLGLCKLVIIANDDLSVCQTLRASTMTTNLPIFLAQKKQNNLADALEKGITDILDLPLQTTVVQLRLRSWLKPSISSTALDFEIYENAPVMMYVLNRDSKIIFVNRQWRNILGYAKESILGHSFTELLHPESIRQLVLDDADFWENGVVHTLNLKLKNSSGEYLEFLADSSVYTNDKFQYVLVYLRDLSEQRRVEASLKQSLERTQTIMNNIRDIVLVIDNHGRYVQIPSIGNPYIDMPLHKYEGRSLHELMDKVRADYLLGVVQDVLRTGESRTIEYDLMVDEKLRWHNTVISRLTPTTVVSVSRDVTDSKQRDANLRDTDRLYRNLFESATDAIIVVDINHGAVLEANDSAAQLLGYSLEELKQKSIFDVEEMSSLEDNTTTTSVSPISKDFTLIEQFFKHKSGRKIPVELHSRVIRFKGKGALLYFVRDVTHRQQILKAENKLRVLAENLRDSAAAFNKTLTLREALETAMQFVLKIVPGPMANVMLLDNDNIRMERWVGYDKYGFTDDQMSSINLALKYSTQFQKMIETQNPILINDTVAENWNRQEFITTGFIKSYISAPIIVKNQIIGFVSIDGDKPNQFETEQLNHLQAFCNQLAIAIQNARLMNEMQDANVVLEERVQQRTESLIRANMSLRRLIDNLKSTEDSLEYERSLLRKIIDAIPDMIYVKDISGRYILLNYATLQAFGKDSFDEAIQKTVADMFPEDYAVVHREIDNRIIATGEPVVNYNNLMPYSDGTFHRQLLTKQPLYDKYGKIMGIVGINRDITEIRLIEESLNQEREQLRQVLMSARCLLWVAIIKKDDVNLTWNMQILNESTAHAILPLDTSSLSYLEAWQKSIMPEDWQRRRYLLQAHLQYNRNSFSHELRSVREDGEMIWLSEEVEIRELEKDEWRLVGVCIDITARKKAETELQSAYGELELRIHQRTAELVQTNATLRQEVIERQRAEEAERRQRILAEALTKSVATLTNTLERDTIFDYLLDMLDGVLPHKASNIMLLDENQEWVSIVRNRGYDDNPPIVEDYALVNWPEKLLILQNNQHYIINDTQNHHGWLTTPSTTWIRSNLCVPIRMEEGIIGFLNLDSDYPNTFTQQHAEWLQAFADQVSIAIRNSRQLVMIRSHANELETIVSERTAQIRSILGSIREGLIFHDMEEKVIYFNSTFVDMTKHSYDDLSSRSIYDVLLRWKADERTHLPIKWERALSLYGFYESEVEVLRSDGTSFPAFLMRVVVKDDNSQKIGTLTLVRDISQAKQLQEQRERFVANASHELRTPIANIKTRLYLMRRKPENFEENILIAESAINWIQRLIDDMFDLARFERGTFELKRELVSVNKLISSIISFQTPEAESKYIRLSASLPVESVEALLDNHRFMQVVSNLVSNALNYTPNGGSVIVALNTEINANEIQELIVTVRDTGRGIAPENLSNLFRPFFRVNDDGKGAGLGLAISQEIVSLHGGTIEVESELQKGSCFTIRIPLLRGDYQD
jgi:PAS domain S-box-containing protein